MASILDRRVAEIAAQREAERADRAEQDRTEQDRISKSTDTINRGMSNPLVWILSIGGIVLIPVTGGLSIGALIVALLILTGGGRACAQAIPPTAADLTAPKAGCTRIFAALGVLILTIIVILLFCAAIAYNLGVKP